jgi:hypothetical protein
MKNRWPPVKWRPSGFDDGPQRSQHRDVRYGEVIRVISADAHLSSAVRSHFPRVAPAS